MSWGMTGQWGMILENLATIDPQRSRIPAALLADVHEMAILELADVGQVELAHAALRLSADELDAGAGSKDPAGVDAIPKSRLVEQRLAALASMRASIMQQDAEQRMSLPTDYYGHLSKEKRRREIGNRLAETIPTVPSSRLTSLLQQALKWQAHTGQLPIIRSHWEEEEEEEDDAKRKPKRRKKEFDLVLGEVDAPSSMVTEATMADEAFRESIPSKPYSTIKFGMEATPECAIFLPDASGLVTGSSDGLVEIWDPQQRFSKLRLDLSYQEKEDLLWHSTAVISVAVSNDGTLLATGSVDGAVKVWRIDTGKCLREITAHDDAVVSCLAFSNDASHLLSASHDSTCREFGLRTSRMLKEFRGHTSYINTCQYVLEDGGAQLRVITGSADGTTRIWDGKTAEVMRVLRPVSLGDEISCSGSSIMMDHQTDSSSEGGSPNIHTVFSLHTPSNCMMIVPRGSRAFLVTYRGLVVRTFDMDASGKVFVAATVSPSNHWLYAVTDTGSCCVFDVQTGAMEKSIREFATQSASNSGDGKRIAEVSGLVHHPHKGIVAAFSNDKGQKRGLLTLWK
jgi:WD40 repeat-containing protein SMU1